ncbi:hypothetical protein QA641_24470 [Bradyrhizobium sp. CB1650]|uniref:hypothetical protein n=1 Tax=Bradyrhizobium sp. CB1650 TaxID=3039153 RepID=UPI0024348D26|nr:hypothetical protein [Bradyrhizobium sp. CB1650]WGD48801.1 hypothetical protein QA641_24470 [Bradyrhizobium sp. CB1650]
MNESLHCGSGRAKTTKVTTKVSDRFSRARDPAQTGARRFACPIPHLPAAARRMRPFMIGKNFMLPVRAITTIP